MAAVGSAVGLGNIWRFPYICGKYGGGAFLLVYILFVFFLGMVLLMSEFVIGRRSQHTPVFAIEALSPKHKSWKYVGIIAIVGCFCILSQYWVLSGWTLSYFFDACTGVLATMGQDSELLNNYFVSFSTSVGRPILCLSVFVVITAVIILGGVRKGVEAVSKVLMPVLIVLLLVLSIRSLTMPGASQGLSYLFSPDFSKLTSEGVLAALGQALFSLSVGMTAMVVYGSYIPKDDNLLKTSLWITFSDTLIAICSGIVIFPAVFACGMEPAGGPGLVFKVLPAVFNSMGSMGGVFSSLFFLLIVLASLTSAISLLEGLMACFAETFTSHRLKSTIVISLATALVAVVISLGGGVWNSFTIAGKNMFDFIDSINSIYLPPLSALGTILFFGWVMRQDDIIDELSNHSTLKVGYYPVLRFLARYLAPIALVIVIISGMFM